MERISVLDHKHHPSVPLWRKTHGQKSAPVGAAPPHKMMNTIFLCNHFEHTTEPRTLLFFYIHELDFPIVQLLSSVRHTVAYR